MAPKIVDLRNKRSAPPSRRKGVFNISVRGEKPSSSLRARRRKARLVVIATLIVILALLAGAVHWIAYRPAFRIQTIVIEGEREMPPQIVEEYARSLMQSDSWRFLPLDSIFLYPKDAIGDAVAVNYPRIKSSTVAREKLLSTEITVTIVEREPFAYWCADPSRCYAMDEEGFVFSHASSTRAVPQTAYVFSGGITDANPIGQSFAPAYMDELTSLLVKLGGAGFMATRVHAENDRDLTLSLARGYNIKTSFGADAEKIVRDLELVLASDTLRGKEGELDYIDLRFGNRVYYKLKGEEEAQE